MKLDRLRLTNVAGYRAITWTDIDPGLNLLLGKNGAGKSSVVQALSLTLSYLGGRRTEDLITRSYPQAQFELWFDGNREPVSVDVRSMRANQSAEKQYPISVLQVVEHRQPKNVVGSSEPDARHHPTLRYRNALSDLKFMIESDDASMRALANRVFELCKRIEAAGRDEDWDWIRKELVRRGPKRIRPLSCGQYDIAALVLDLVRFADSLAEEDAGFVLFDSPETFLHPAAQEPVLQLTREMLPDCQIFVASHSLKLLSQRDPRTVFWLSREHENAQNEVEIFNVRKVESGSKELFFELYGDDVSSAVLGLLTAYESLEYYEFLVSCASPPGVVSRLAPHADRQMQEVVGQIRQADHAWAVLDFGAGDGDLLAALLMDRSISSEWRYVAVEPAPSEMLEQRLQEAVENGLIAETSHVVACLADLDGTFDAVVLCNVCHEILPPRLPAVIGQLLSRHLRSVQTSKLVIHEVETLSVGEREFIVWNPSDFRHIMKGIPGLKVQDVSIPRNKGVPLETTVITLDLEIPLPNGLGQILEDRFGQFLARKKNDCLDEIAHLLEERPPAGGMAATLRQRRHAFLVAQVATICELERQ